ncbi:MAG: hypothetical protein ACOX2J_05340 [Bacillota bacterium]
MGKTKGRSERRNGLPCFVYADAHDPQSPPLQLPQLEEEPAQSLLASAL